MTDVDGRLLEGLDELPMPRWRTVDPDSERPWDRTDADALHRVRHWGPDVDVPIPDRPVARRTSPATARTTTGPARAPEAPVPVWPPVHPSTIVVDAPRTDAAETSAHPIDEIPPAHEWLPDHLATWPPAPAAPAPVAPPSSLVPRFVPDDEPSPFDHDLDPEVDRALDAWTRADVGEFVWGEHEPPWWQRQGGQLPMAAALASFGVILLLLAAVGLPLLTGGDGEPADDRLTSSVTVRASEPDPVALDGAVARARSASGGAFPDGELAGLIPAACAAAEARNPAGLAGRISTLEPTKDALPVLMRALRAGALEQCPDAIEGYPTLLTETPPMVLTVHNPAATASAAVDPSMAAAMTSTSPTATASSGSPTTWVVTPGQPCSPSGATGQTSSGTPATCAPSCNPASGALAWRAGAC